ncbi:MAG: hypothetical protein ACQETL_04625 [Bacteroidota bacterium]
MEVKNQNLLEAIQGKWHCRVVTNKITDEKTSLEFSLLISENLISRSGDGEQFWPAICNFELVGPIKDGYFYREDGCFIQVKSVTDEQLVIELSNKNKEGELYINVFYFEKEIG